MKPLRAFAMGIRGQQIDPPTVVNARTPGQAKMEYLRQLDGCFNVKFIDLTCRCLGEPQTSRNFQRNAEYRGKPYVKCGDRVKVGESLGVIVGHNSSANFDVLFDDNAPKYAGMRLNVHPDSCEF